MLGATKASGDVFYCIKGNYSVPERPTLWYRNFPHSMPPTPSARRILTTNDVQRVPLPACPSPQMPRVLTSPWRRSSVSTARVTPGVYHATKECRCDVLRAQRKASNAVVMTLNARAHTRPPRVTPGVHHSMKECRCDVLRAQRKASNAVVMTLNARAHARPPRVTPATSPCPENIGLQGFFHFSLTHAIALTVKSTHPQDTHSPTRSGSPYPHATPHACPGNDEFPGGAVPSLIQRPRALKSIFIIPMRQPLHHHLQQDARVPKTHTNHMPLCSEPPPCPNYDVTRKLVYSTKNDEGY